MSRRRGVSLVELMVVISVSVVMLGLIAGLIQTMVSAERDGRAHLVRSTTLGRLAEEFRQDVRAALAADPAAAQDEPIRRIELSQPENRTVEYVVRAQSVLKTVREAGKLAQQDEFRLASHATARLEITIDGTTNIVSLVVIQMAPPAKAPTPRIVRVQAQLGKDRRLAAKEATPR